MVSGTGRDRIEAPSIVKPIRVEPEVNAELAAAVAWYEDRRPGLGRELLAEIDSVFAAIARSPSRFPAYPRVERDLGVRRVATRRFLTQSPFSISTPSFVCSPSVMNAGAPVIG